MILFLLFYIESSFTQLFFIEPVHFFFYIQRYLKKHVGDKRTVGHGGCSETIKNR